MKPEDFDDNRSWWAATAPGSEPCPPLRGDVTADVAIVGGGFTGVSTALALAKRRPGLGIVLLEARTIGNGASGRNGGQVLNSVNGVGSDDLALYKRVWDITHAGIEAVFARASQGGVRAKRAGALECFTDAKRAEHAHAEVERLNGAGIPVRFVQGDELRRLCRAERVVGAILDPTAGVLSGLDLLRADKPRLAAAGVRVFEETPVTTVREGAPIELRTPDGTVRTNALVLATNGYSHLLGYFGDRVFPLLSHALSVPLAEEAWGEAGCFSDDMDRISYAARVPGGELVFGGGSNAAYDYRFGGRTSAGDTPRASAALARRLGDYFPGIARSPASYRWSGTLGITLSRRPSIGRRGNVYWGVGYAGHGVTLANIAGEILADLYVGDTERWEGLPFVNGPMGYIPPEPFRWVGYHAYTAVTGKSPRRG